MSLPQSAMADSPDTADSAYQERRRVLIWSIFPLSVDETKIIDGGKAHYADPQTHGRGFQSSKAQVASNSTESPSVPDPRPSVARSPNWERISVKASSRRTHSRRCHSACSLPANHHRPRRHSPRIHRIRLPPDHEPPTRQHSPRKTPTSHDKYGSERLVATPRHVLLSASPWGIWQLRRHARRGPLAAAALRGVGDHGLAYAERRRLVGRAAAAVGESSGVGLGWDPVCSYVVGGCFRGRGRGVAMAGNTSLLKVETIVHSDVVDC
jgi:hypothetical protein